MSNHNHNGDDYGPKQRTPIKRPPQNVEVERGVIGSLWLDPECAHDVFAKLVPENFLSPLNELLFRRMKDQYDAGLPFDTVSLWELLGRNGEQGRVTEEDFHAITDSVPHAANANYYADIIIRLSRSRDLIQAATTILSDAYADQLPADELQAKAEEAVLAAGDAKGAKPIRLFSDAISGAMATIRKREAEGFKGLRSGFPDLDDTIDGLKAGNLIILAARPSMGKTALGLNIASNVSIDQRIQTLFVSLEMSESELAERNLSARSGVGAHLLRGIYHLGEHKRAEIWRDLEATQDEIDGAPFWIDDKAGSSINQIAAMARRVKAKFGLGLIVIDYLQYIVGPRLKGESREQEVARISARLKKLARDLNIPALVLAQLNRESERREDRRPRMADLRESGGLEQDADVVLLLHRPEMIDPNDQPGIAELEIAKNRDGRVGRVKLVFDRFCTRFDSLKQDFEPPIEANF